MGHTAPGTEQPAICVVGFQGPGDGSPGWGDLRLFIPLASPLEGRGGRA